MYEKWDNVMNPAIDRLHKEWSHPSEVIEEVFKFSSDSRLVTSAEEPSIDEEERFLSGVHVGFITYVVLVTFTSLWLVKKFLSLRFEFSYELNFVFIFIPAFLFLFTRLYVI